MTDKELQKLGRRELLQLLLDQAKETDRLSKMLRETEEQLSQVEEGYERLRERLDQKDAQIHELQDTIQAEREKREADLSEVGSIAEAALRLNGVFDAAQQAADQYLQSVKQFYAIPEGAEPRLKQPVQEPVRQPEPQPQPEWALPDDEPYSPELDWSSFTEPAQPRASERTALPRERERERERRSSRREREEASQSKLPFRVKKRKENGKTTLFFGWQHD